MSTLLFGTLLLAMAFYGGYLFGKAVGRVESAEDRRLASETWRLSQQVNRLTNDIINEAQTSLTANPRSRPEVAEAKGNQTTTTPEVGAVKPLEQGAP